MAGRALLGRHEGHTGLLQILLQGRGNVFDRLLHAFLNGAAGGVVGFTFERFDQIISDVLCQFRHATAKASRLAGWQGNQPGAIGTRKVVYVATILLACRLGGKGVEEPVHHPQAARAPCAAHVDVLSGSITFQPESQGFGSGGLTDGICHGINLAGGFKAEG